MSKSEKQRTTAALRSQQVAAQTDHYKSLSQSPQQLGATIIRDIERENSQMFSGFRREYQGMVLAAANGEEIDADRFGNLCFHLGVDVEKWNADIAAMEKRFELQKTAAQFEALESKASEAEAKLNQLIQDRAAAWNAATVAIREQEEALRMAMFARDQTLEARDELRRMRDTTAEEKELQKQLVGEDRLDGFTLMGHADGLLDRIAKCEAALNPNASHGQPSYAALSCSEYPAVVIRETEAELARFKRSAGAPPVGQVGKLERRIAVAKGCLELKKAELAELRRQEAAIRQRMAEISAANL